MSLVIEDMKVPIHIDQHGTARVGGTRVTLHTVICGFQDGETPEEIVMQYNALKLADVYAVIAFYLTHQAAVDANLREYEEEGERVRREIESRCPQAGLRERLLARKQQREVADAKVPGG